METVVIHCICGEEYQTSINMYGLTCIPPKTVEEAISPCPGCDVLYKNETVHAPEELRHIHMKPQEGGLIDETARAVGMVR